MPDNLVERVHQPQFPGGGKSAPKPTPRAPNEKVQRPPVKEHPAPLPRKK
jgi:hypothetical protein